MQSEIITQKNGKGIFDRKAWLAESKKLYLSAKILRAEGDKNKNPLHENNKTLLFMNILISRLQLIKPADLCWVMHSKCY